MANEFTDKLCDALLNGTDRIADIKLMPGSDPAASSEDVAKELWQSMVRMGLIDDGKFVKY